MSASNQQDVVVKLADLVGKPAARPEPFVLSAEEKHEIEHELTHFPDGRAASIEALKIVQKHRGWVPDGALEPVAQMIGISAAELEGVATFYSLIYRQPVGRHVIKVCDSITCFLVGYEDIRTALSRHPAPLVACHCDPLCENFLDTGERMWIVDWEYSGMNDPMWDLGDLAVEGKFGERQEEEMIRAYFGGEPRPAERGRIVIYKAMCDLLWTLWGLIQLASGNPAEDFRAYADGRFARCRKLMQTRDFSRHVEAVRKG